MKLIKKIASVALAATLAFTLVVPANAQVSYDPNGDSNHGLYIDTTLVQKVAKEGSDIVVNDKDKIITTKSNVQFQLDANVDATWEIEVAKGASDKVKEAVDSGAIGVDSTGFVTIKAGVPDATYTVVAAPENIEDASDSMRCAIKVEGESATVDKDSIVYDAEKIESENDNMKVSEDGKTLTITGSVTGTGELDVKYQPSYVIVDAKTYENSKGSETYALTGHSGNKITSKKVTKTSVVLNAKVEATTIEGEPISANTDLNVVVKDVDFEKKLECLNFGTEKAYNLKLNQDVSYAFLDNSANTLADDPATVESWIITQNDEDNATKEIGKFENGTARDLPITNVKGEKIATLHIDADGEHLNIVTEKKVKYTSKETIHLAPAYTLKGASSATTPEKTTISINTAESETVSQVDVDFSKKYELNKNYSIGETLNGQDVYYFEANDGVIDLAAATFAEKDTCCSFNEAKAAGFIAKDAVNNVAYTTSYTITSVDGVNKEYLSKLETGIISNKEYDSVNKKGNGIISLSPDNIGYFGVKVETKNNQTGDNIEGKSLIIRIVSSAADIADLKVAQSETKDYDIDGETIHIRQGEAVTPTLNDKSVTLNDPFLTYKFEDIVGDEVATAYRNQDDVYAITGNAEGKTLVTARSTVNEEESVSFILYVNKDYMDGKFHISFDDAAAAKVCTINNDSGTKVAIIKGVQKEVPVRVISEQSSAGIPKVTWSVDCKNSVAEINEKGILTTKVNSGGQNFTVTATSMSDKTKTSTFDVRIEDVSATGISEISEKDTDYVTITAKNAGTCAPGKTFTLYASSYVPKEATTLDGTITWKSKDESVATVDAKTGVVQTIKNHASVEIEATYVPKSGKASTPLVFNLKVEGEDVAVTDIDVTSAVTINRVGGNANLDAKVVPSNASNKALKYTSSDEKVATVSDGKVTAISAGTCTITVSSVADPTIKKTVTVTVKGESDEDIKKPDTTTQAPAATTQAPAAPTTTTVAAPTTEAPAAVTAPAKVKISSAKNVKGKKLTIKFKKIAGVKTYQIVYSLKKNFKGKKTINTTKTSYTIKKLKKGKTYYVKVRAKNAAGFGKFSAVKKVKIKK